MRKLIVHSVLVFIAFTLPARAGLVVNEVLSNEPISDEMLEWFELFNNSTGAANLAFYALEVVTFSDSVISVNLNGTIPAGQFLVVCRDSVRFEEHWGDSSGLWGDDPIEQTYSILQPGTAFKLTNGSGAVRLFRLLTLESEMTWSTSGVDGYSWERAELDQDFIGQSVDPTGSTPGRVNSLTKVAVDLSLDSVGVWLVNGLAHLEFTIVNRGRTDITNATLGLYYRDETEPDSLGQLFESKVVSPLDTGYTKIVYVEYPFFEYYQDIVAKLPDDDRIENNRIDFTAPGINFPPVILSEVLANPTSGSAGEWVELKNISPDPFDIAGWMLADLVGPALITSESTVIDPGGYLVVVKDSLDFLSSYPGFVHDYLQAANWQVLNDRDEVVLLIDRFSLEANRLVYSSTFSDNHTWSRAESGDHAGQWGRSEQPGGSPGEANRVRFGAEGNTRLEITIRPRIISPDGDGYEDEAVIAVTPPEAGSYTLEIFDSEGRKVRVFEDGAMDLRPEYVWDGRDDQGSRLPIGIYIVYFEASGVESVKKTVVLAR